MNFRNCICAALAAANALASPAFAAPIELITHILREERVSAGDGTTSIRLVPVRRAVPGDRLVYILAYRNSGRAPVANLVLEDPLPPGIAYRAPADGSPAPELSVDGSRFGPLATLVAATPQGAPRAAGPDDVTRVRWRISGPLVAGEQGQVSFRAQLK